MSQVCSFVIMVLGCGAVAVAQDFQVDGSNFESRYGHAVAIGDWNADGHPDLAVGAWNDNVPGPDWGRVYLHLGPLDGNALDHQAEVIFEPRTFQMMGYSVAFGDWNGDEYDDLLIGALDAQHAGEGRAYVYLGGTNTGVFDDLDAHATFDGGAYSGLFGFSVALGDWDGDGLDDALVGARSEDGQDGKAYIFLGGRSGLTLDEDADVILDGTIRDGQFGQSVAFGNWNGDAYADALIGAQGPGQSQLSGNAYLFFGGGVGFLQSSAADVRFDGSGGFNKFGHSVDLGDWDGDGLDDALIGDPKLNGSAGGAYLFLSTGQGGLFDRGDAAFRMTGTDGVRDGEFGFSVAMGDYDRDGYEDALIGARFDDRGCLPSDCGQVFLFLGNQYGGQQDSSAFRAHSGSTNGERFGYDTALADANGDGMGDLVVGASRAVTAAGSSGRSYVFRSDAPFSGSVPDGARVPGPPLRVGKAADDALSLEWGASCHANDSDYAVYGGDLGAYPGHRDVTCSTGGETTFVFWPVEGNRYYLIVPANPQTEGSYGTDSRGVARPQGLSSCRPSIVGECSVQSRRPAGESK